ncbi:hypothetical protein MBAV_002092 [Candidatus Magnetobacterium bavaricum]|uniref:REase AHJR-like domain-containing protein n=1 Tax=Candidatus Magnetobacterium bavaricum TaxID=29290 RepID=A0A0F3GV08_9BACT|nr:hypothetical protein MBAV_002092 [Candidatus Magnetobacterium bavaricum]
MDIKREIISKYLPNMIVDQLADKYERQGYQVDRDYNIVDNYHADLFAQNAVESIVFEVKSGTLTPDKKAKLKALGAYIKSKVNWKFKLVLAEPPSEKEIIIEDIEDILTVLLGNSDVPYELSKDSKNVRFDKVSDVEVKGNRIHKDGKIEVNGIGFVDVVWQYGEAMKTTDSFPFTFVVTLDFANSKHELNSLMVDTSSFEEEDSSDI